MRRTSLASIAASFAVSIAIAMAAGCSGMQKNHQNPDPTTSEPASITTTPATTPNTLAVPVVAKDSTKSTGRKIVKLQADENKDESNLTVLAKGLGTVAR